MVLAQIRKPVIVVDLSYLQGLKHGQEFLSAKSFWLWPFRIFQEAGDKGEKTQGVLSKLLRIYKINDPRLAIAASPRELSLDELNGQPIEMKSLVDILLTQSIGHIADNAGEYSGNFAEALDRLTGEINTRHNGFWAILITMNKQIAPECSATDFGNNIASDRSQITNDLAITHLGKFVSFIDPEDKNHISLNNLSDTNSPTIALAKCILYISLRMKFKPLAKKELNDYDDIHYAILGSLTGHIATNDNGLIRMVRVCFPDTKITTHLKKALITHQ